MVVLKLIYLGCAPGNAMRVIQKAIMKCGLNNVEAGVAVV